MITISFSEKDKVLKGEISVPASKSESNRVLIIQALCKDKFDIFNLSEADDTKLLKNLLDKTNNHSDGITVLDAKNAGTAYRFLTSHLAFKPGKWLLTGSERMKQRPVGLLVDALREIGVDIKYKENQGYPPLLINGIKLTDKYNNKIQVDADISSQYISSLMLAAPTLPKGLVIQLKGSISSLPYIDMTLKVMEHFGIRYHRKNNVISIEHQEYRAKDYHVEADWTSASYWYEMAAFSDKTDLIIKGLKKESYQGDSVVAGIFKNFGVNTEYLSDSIHLSKYDKKTPAKFEFDFYNNPDLAQTLAVTCAGLNIPAHLKGLQNLKIKETDRLTALNNELNKLGFNTEIINESELLIHKTNTLNKKQNLTVTTYDDHRMAMAFALLAMIFDILRIENPDVIEKSYPDFYNNLSYTGFQII